MSTAPTDYLAQVRWQRQPGEAFTDNRYARRHQWAFDGGAVVPGSSSPHSVRLPFSDASAVDPEEALVAAAASCHLLCFLYLAAKAGWVVDDYTDDAVGLMAPDASGLPAITRITLNPVVRFAGAAPDAAAHAALHEQAHHDCYIARSIKAEIVCRPRVAG